MFSLFSKNYIDKIEPTINELDNFDNQEKIEIINKLRLMIHDKSPFKNEPVDYVQWVKNDIIEANDYNPNVVAPPEMKLLSVSIEKDGYTQPIVSWRTNEHYEVVDGFHRYTVGKNEKKVNDKIYGYLPLVVLNDERSDRGDRISSTIRHNRARGKHTIKGMSDIVLELKRRNRSNAWISKNLGLDEDEILRLCQITGLSELFSDQEFSKSWDIEKEAEGFKPLSDDINDYGTETKDFRTVNTNDDERIFHTFDKWECYRAGFYNTTANGFKKEEAEMICRDFLSDINLFSETLEKVITEWKYSCEHYLTNKSMNRIAYLGQASVCYATGIPAICRSGFNLLTDEQQKEANETALIYLNKWLGLQNMKQVTLDEALSGKQMEIY